MLAKLKTTRAGHRGATTRLFNRFDEEELNEEEIASIIETLQEKQKILTELNGQILEKTLDEEISQEIEDTDQWSVSFKSKLLKIKKFANSRTHSDSNLNPNAAPFNLQPSYSNVSFNSYHKIPKLTLPKFDGQITQWQSFWDSFECAVHNNPTLNSVQKFTYLKNQLEHEASDCIALLPITNSSYDQAVSLLSERFRKPHKIKNAFMKNLIDLQYPKSNSLRLFYDKMESYIRGLESLGQHKESYGDLLIPIILNKLPTDVRQNITRENGDDNWDIQSLRTALKKEICIQEAGQLDYFECISSTPTASFVTGISKSTPHVKSANGNNEGKNKITSKPCVFCSEIHAPVSCKKVTDINERKAIIKEKRLCFNCFAKHRVSDCKSKCTCKKCDKKHYTSICHEHGTKNDTATESKSNENTAAMHSTSEMTASHVLLKTAIAPVSSNDGNRYRCNILFDEGAQRTFIQQSFANSLRYKSLGFEELHIIGFGGKKLVQHVEKIRVDVHTENDQKINIEAVVVPDIAAPIEMRTQEVYKLPYIRNLKLAHYATENEKFEVQLLIGADYYWSFIQDNVIRGDGPTAAKSKLGYLLSGPVKNKTTKERKSSAMLNILLQRENNECDLEKFWKLETLGISTEDKDESIDAKMKNYQDTHIYLRDNRYYAKLPWKDEHPELLTNENIAKKRTVNVVNRQSREPKLLEINGNIISEQEIRGFVEKVPTEKINTDKQVHYIPHHPVKKDSITTPIGIVYDCSCKQDGASPSLNDCLSSDPPILNDLSGILTRFRTKRYGISTDIENAFLQINLDENDKDVTIVWFIM